LGLIGKIMVRPVVRNIVKSVHRNLEGSASSGQSYWKVQSEVLFFGEISKITGGRLYNQKAGSTDYLTVGGSAGSYTFQAPDTTPYKNADTDYIWFTTTPTQRTTTEAELIGYDFTRTIIKYDNTTPYAIRTIMILSSTETSNGAKENKMRDDFSLSIWWSNVLSSYGVIKGNRNAERSIMTAAPSSLILTVLDANRIQIDFTDNSGGTKLHSIEKSIYNESSYSELVLNAETTVTYISTGLLPSTTYYYRVRDFNGVIYSAYCTSVSAITLGDYDDDSKALFVRMLAADGVAQTDLRKTAIDTVIKALKAATLWSTKFDGFGITRGTGLASSKLNWIEDDHNLTKGGAGTLTFTDDVGYHGDGSSTYLKTDYVPNVDGVHLVLDSASFGVKISGTVTLDATGHGGGGSGVWGCFLYQNLGAGYNRLNSSASGGGKRVAGYNCLARTVNTTVKQYTNAATADITCVSSAVTEHELYLLAFNNNGTAGGFCATAEVIEMWFYGAYITQAEFLTIQSIVNAYIAAL
jgi:hypothetical protein